MFQHSGAFFSIFEDAAPMVPQGPVAMSGRISSELPRLRKLGGLS